MAASMDMEESARLAGRSRTPAKPPPLEPVDERFQVAAIAYFVYGLFYLVGGGYLMMHGVGVRGSRSVATGAWLIAGLALVIGIPLLLRRRRAWFERWILSRRDFARILAAFLVFRALNVLRVAVRPDVAEVPAPWGGTMSFRMGAVVFFGVTVAACCFVALAAWTRETTEST